MSSTTATAPWRNRITGSGTLKVAEALANPLNFRNHPPVQRAALAAFHWIGRGDGKLHAP